MLIQRWSLLSYYSELQKLTTAIQAIKELKIIKFVDKIINFFVRGLIRLFILRYILKGQSLNNFLIFIFFYLAIITNLSLIIYNLIYLHLLKLNLAFIVQFLLHIVIDNINVNFHYFFNIFQ